MRTGRTRGNGGRGFTLIELLVVVAIVGILAAVVVGHYQRAIVKAKEAVLRENLFRTRTAINHYFADKGKYPADIRALVDDHYLTKMPEDPITQSSDSWVPVAAEMSEDDISLEPGIKDLRSGATGTGLDGTPYADW